MTYECNQCGSTLPAHSVSCAQCGSAFSEPVPADAITPGNGFHAGLDRRSEALGSQTQLDADVRSLKNQVVQLTNRTTVLEMAERENKRRFTDHVQDVLRGLQQLERHAS